MWLTTFIDRLKIRWKERRIKKLKREISLMQQYQKIQRGHQSRKAHVEAMIEKGLLSRRAAYGSIVSAWRSRIARPFPKRKAVGSSPTADTI